MYRLIYDGKILCEVPDTTGRTMPSLNIGEEVEIGGVKFKIINRKTFIQISPLGGNQSSIQKVEIYLERIKNEGWN